MASSTGPLTFSNAFSPKEIKQMIRGMDIFKSGVAKGLERLDVRFDPDDLSKVEVSARWETMEAAKEMLEVFPKELEAVSKGEGSLGRGSIFTQRRSWLLRLIVVGQAPLPPKKNACAKKCMRRFLGRLSS